MHYASERSQIQKATYYDSIHVEHLYSIKGKTTGTKNKSELGGGD